MKIKTQYKKLILMDLDGVLNEYTGEYIEGFIPPMKQGAKEFLKSLSKNYRVVVFTTRPALLVSKWLIKNKIDRYVENVTNTKLPAFLHIDDRVLCHNGIFEDILYRIPKFQPYWKRQIST